MAYRSCAFAVSILLIACGGDDSARTPNDVDRDGGSDGGSGGRSASGGSAAASGGRAAGGASAGGTSAGGTSTGGTSGGTSTGGTADSGGKSAGGSDAGPDASDSGGTSSIPDAAPDAPQTCDFGSVGSFATQQQLNLFGDIVYFGDGAELPPGRYRVSFIDGCMKYASDQAWTVHAYPNGQSAAWWLVGDTSSNRIVVPPGTSGYSSGPTGNGAFATFDECVAANQALPPLEFDFVGGKLGVWLLDSNYGDNLAGVDGRNPKWNLTLLEACRDQ